MNNDHEYLVTHNFSHKLEDVVGKFILAPTPQAEMLWAVLKEHPDQFHFELSYSEEDSKKQLREISIVMKHGDKR